MPKVQKIASIKLFWKKKVWKVWNKKKK